MSSTADKTYSGFTKLIITPDRIVFGIMERMNKATYRIVAWLFIISGNFLAFSGVVTNMWVTNTIGRADISDPSGFSSIYAYASILVLGGIVLIVMGIVFVMYARQPTASPLIN